jgi:ribosomal protein S18 acetylase RimI-like enzyme
MDSKREIQITQMEIDDLPEVYHIGEELFTRVQTPSLYRTWDEYEVTQFFNSDPEFCLAAEIEGRLVGFVLGTTVTKPRSSWKYGYLAWIGVKPDFQRLGVGSCLLKKLMEIMVADGVRMIIVDSQTENKPSLRFFRKHGFNAGEEHVYLFLNLSPKIRRKREKSRN